MGERIKIECLLAACCTDDERRLVFADAAAEERRRLSLESWAEKGIPTALAALDRHYLRQNTLRISVIKETAMDAEKTNSRRSEGVPALDEVIDASYRKALVQADGNLSRASRILKISRTTFYSRAKARGLVALLLMVSLLGYSQKQATQLLAVSAPSAPTGLFGIPLPSVKIAAQPTFVDRATMSLRWEWPFATNDLGGFTVYWGYTATTRTNKVIGTTKTNMTVNVPEGGVYWFSVRSRDRADVESVDSNVVTATADMWGDIAPYIWQYRTRGRTGVTNRVDDAPTVNGPWTTRLRFVGTGSLTNILSTNTTQRYFRTVPQ